jgi:hypothetical protein
VQVDRVAPRRRAALGAEERIPGPVDLRRLRLPRGGAVQHRPARAGNEPPTAEGGSRRCVKVLRAVDLAHNVHCAREERRTVL